MKKVVFFLLFFSCLFSGKLLNAQLPVEGDINLAYIGAKTSCGPEVTDVFKNCIKSNDFNTVETYGPGSLLFVSIKGIPFNDQVQNCVSQFNSDKKKCPSAPTLICGVKS